MSSTTMTWKRLDDMGQDDPIGRADALLARLRENTPVTGPGEFPVLTDVVAIPAEFAQGDSQLDMPRTGQQDPDGESGHKSGDLPSGQVPDIGPLIQREVLKRLELILPDLAVQAGMIAQQAFETSIRKWGSPDLGQTKPEPAQAESPVLAGKPRQV